MSGSPCTTYGDIRASTYIWDTLWKRNQPSFIKFNVLDAIQTDGGKIFQWLFTSSEGFVKSKSKSKWNIAAIKERCASDDKDAHLRANCSLALEVLEWRSVVHLADLEPVFNTENSSKSVLILYRRIGGSVSYLETTYEIVSDLLPPKLTTFPLCGSEATGSRTAGNKRSVPSGKIKSLNKTLNAATKSVTLNLVHIVETRQNVRVVKIVIVYVVESNGTFGSSNDKTLWLHHTSSLVITTNRPQKILRRNTHSEALCNSGNYIGNKSNGIQRNVSPFHRAAKCAGDFCKYSDREELKHFDPVAVECSDTTADLGKWLQCSLEEPKLNGKILVTEVEGETGSRSPPTAGDNIRAAAETECPASLGLHSVRYKSILQARQDMVDLNLGAQGVASSLPVRKLWPLMLQNWWWRVGSAMTPERPKYYMSSSLKAEGSSGLSSSIRAALDSGTGQVSPTLTSSHDRYPSEEELSLDDCTVSTNKNFVPYDLTENSYQGERRRSVGMLSWYYSEASVCAACYSVYRDIDTRRRSHQKRALATKLLSTTEHRDRALNSPKQQQHRTILRSKLVDNWNIARRSSSGEFRKLEQSLNSPGEVSLDELGVTSGSCSYSRALSAKSSPSKPRLSAPSQGDLPPLGSLKDSKVRRVQRIISAGARSAESGGQARNPQEHCLTDGIDATGLCLSDIGSPNDDHACTFTPFAAAEASHTGSTTNAWEHLTRGAVRAVSEGAARKYKEQPLSRSSRGVSRKQKEYDSSRLLNQNHKELNELRATLRKDRDAEETHGESRSDSRANILKRKKSNKSLIPGANLSEYSVKSAPVPALPPLTCQQKTAAECPSARMSNSIQGDTTPHEDAASESGRVDSVIAARAPLRDDGHCAYDNADENSSEKGTLPRALADFEAIDSPPFSILDNNMFAENFQYLRSSLVPACAAASCSPRDEER